MLTGCFILHHLNGITIRHETKRARKEDAFINRTDIKSNEIGRIEMSMIVVPLDAEPII